MNDLTTGKEGKLIFYFAMPMLIGNVFQQLYQITDSIIVGHFLGKQALAAVGASFPIVFTLISLIIGIASGSTVVISQYFGAKNIEKVKSTIDTMYIFLFITSIIVTIVGIASSGWLYSLLNLPPEIMPQAVTYLNVYLLGMVSFFGFNGTSSILRGLGDSKTPLYFLIFSTLLNIVLDLLFILVFKWGVAGAAWATVISQTFAFVASTVYLNKYHKIIKVGFSKLKFDKQIFKMSFNIGFPTGLQQTFVAVGMMALLGIVNGFGTNVIAAYSVASRIDSLALMPAMNFSMALSAFVGQNIGAQRFDRVKNGLNATLKMSSLFSILVSVIVVLFGRFLMHIFTTDSQVINIGYQYLLIVGSCYVAFNVMYIYTGVMRGAGDTLIPMFFTLFSLWIIRVPCAWWLSKIIGEKGIWWSIPIAWIMGAIFTYFYYKTGRWKKKVI